jgi:Icc-related predicted phosphoesterase
MALNWALERAQPAVTVCGHIHEDRGGFSHRGHLVLNVAALDGNYEPYPEAFTHICP